MSKNGFTLIEVLLSFFITSLIVINCSMFYRTLYFSKKASTIDTSIENGIATLSKELITAHNIEYGSSLNYENDKDEKCQVILKNNRLVLTPGYNILCNNIQNVSFKGQDDFIRIDLQHNNLWYSYIIGSDYEIKNE